MELEQAVNKFTLIFNNPTRENDYQNHDRQTSTVLTRVAIYVIYMTNTIYTIVNHLTSTDTSPSTACRPTGSANNGTCVSSSPQNDYSANQYGYYESICALPLVAGVETLALVVGRFRRARGAGFILSIYLQILGVILHEPTSSTLGQLIAAYSPM